MNWKKGILSGISGGVVLIVIGTLFTMLTSSFTMPLLESSAAVWKPMEPLTSWLGRLYAWQFLEGILFGIIYTILYASIPGTGWKKGANYGLLLWFLVTIPGMAMTYLTMAVPTGLIFNWLAEGLISFILMGAVLATAYERLN